MLGGHEGRYVHTRQWAGKWVPLAGAGDVQTPPSARWHLDVEPRSILAHAPKEAWTEVFSAALFMRRKSTNNLNVPQKENGF